MYEYGSTTRLVLNIERGVRKGDKEREGGGEREREADRHTRVGRRRRDA